MSEGGHDIAITMMSQEPSKPAPTSSRATNLDPARVEPVLVQQSADVGQATGLVEVVKKTKATGAYLTTGNVVSILLPQMSQRKPDRRDIEFIQCDLLSQKGGILPIKHGSIGSALSERVSFWLYFCPYASWRWLIYRLSAHTSELMVSQQIYSFSEPLTDPNLNVDTLMSLLNNLTVGRLEACLEIPHRKREEIRQQCTTEEEKKRSYVSWYLKYTPYAVDFTHLAGRLYYYEETSILEQVKQYLRIAPEPTLTLSNLTEALKQVSYYHWDNPLGLSYVSSERGLESVNLLDYLDIPGKKIRDVMIQHPRDFSKKKKAFLQLFLDDHPCPSWKTIAWGLYMVKEYKALKVILKDYYRDINLQELCVKAVISFVKNDEDIDSLPLPERIKQNILEVRTVLDYKFNNSTLTKAVVVL